MSTMFSPVISLVQLRIDVCHPSSSVLRIVAAGVIDLSTADVLRAGLRRALSARPAHHVDVDLGGVTFMDCAGLSALIAARCTAVAAGQHLWITNPQPTVQRVLSLTGLLSVFTATPDQAPHGAAGSGPAPAAVSLQDGPLVVAA